MNTGSVIITLPSSMTKEHGELSGTRILQSSAWETKKYNTGIRVGYYITRTTFNSADPVENHDIILVSNIIYAPHIASCDDYSKVYHSDVYLHMRSHAG